MTFREAIEYYKSQGVTRIQKGSPEYESIMEMCGISQAQRTITVDTTVRYAQPGESRQPLNAEPIGGGISKKTTSKLEWLALVNNRAKFNAHIQKLKTMQ
jgi:hypothetical protein